jgi:nitrate reductase NapE component
MNADTPRWLLLAVVVAAIGGIGLCVWLFRAMTGT